MLALGERDRVAHRIGQAPRAPVELPAVEPQAPAMAIGRPHRGGRLPPAQHRADPGEQLAQAERLGDVVVGAELEPDDPVDRADVAGRGAGPERGDVARPDPLTPENLAGHERQHRQPGRAVALDRVQHGVGIEALEQRDRRAEPQAGEQRGDAAGMHHRQRDDADLPPVDAEACKRLHARGEGRERVGDELRQAGGAGGVEQQRRGVRVRRLRARPGRGMREQLAPAARVRGAAGRAHDEPPVRGQQRGIERRDRVVELAVAEIEGGLEPGEQRHQLRGLEPQVQGRGDRAGLEAGPVGGDQLRQVGMWSATRSPGPMPSPTKALASRSASLASRR